MRKGNECVSVGVSVSVFVTAVTHSLTHLLLLLYSLKSVLQLLLLCFETVI